MIYVICRASNEVVYATSDKEKCTKICNELNSHCAKDMYKTLSFDDNKNNKSVANELRELRKNQYWRVKIDKSLNVVGISVSTTFVKNNVIEKDAWYNYYVYLEAEDRESAIKHALHRAKERSESYEKRSK